MPPTPTPNHLSTYAGAAFHIRMSVRLTSLHCIFNPHKGNDVYHIWTNYSRPKANTLPLLYLYFFFLLARPRALLIPFIYPENLTMHI